MTFDVGEKGFLLHLYETLHKLREQIACPFSSCGTANQINQELVQLLQAIKEHLTDTIGELDIFEEKLDGIELEDVSFGDRDAFPRVPISHHIEKSSFDSRRTMYLHPIHPRIEPSSFQAEPIDTEAPTREIPEIPPTQFLEKLLKDDEE